MLTAEIVVSPGLLQLALGLDRIVDDAGFVLLAGAFILRSLLPPRGAIDRRMITLAVAGLVLLAVGGLGGPTIQLVLSDRLLGDVLSPTTGTALLVRLAALAGGAFFLTDLLRPGAGWRQIVGAAVVSVVAVTLVVRSDGTSAPPRAVALIAGTGHVLAAGLCLGGLVALALVVANRTSVGPLDQLLPRFGRIAVGSVVLLALTGVIEGLANAGGLGAVLGSSYGLVLSFKVVLLAAMVVLAARGRRLAARIAFQRVHQPAALAGRHGPVRALAVVLGAELIIAFGALAASSMLVMLAPHA